MSSNDCLNEIAFGSGAGGGSSAVTVADGADVALGSIADAASSAGGSGTVAAKLRKISADIAALVIANHTDLTAATPAGANLIGKVGIDQTTPGTTNAVAIPAAATSIAKAEDAASADGDVGVAILAVRKATPANTSGTDGDYENLQINGGYLWTRSAPSVQTPTTSQVSVTSASTTLSAAVAAGQIVSITNNGVTTIWVREDGSAPVADTGTFPARNGDGLGIELTPGSTWETPRAVTTAVKGISQTGTVKATVALYPV